VSPFTDVLTRIAEGERLSRSEAREAMDHIMSGEATGAQIGAFLMGLRQRGETPEELAGAAESMRGHATRLDTDRRPLIDTCGTGGDGAGTFNISTAAAFVVAGAGVGVAKHGNRSISSSCGSADVLEALGARIDLAPEASARCLETTGVGFMFAPYYHPAARHAAGPRRELAMRTLFNLLGPLCNPAPLTHQIMGIFTPDLLETAAAVLGLLGMERALVVHGDGGLDEIALSGPTRVAEWRDGAVFAYTVTPEALGVSRAPVEALAGGDAAHNAALIRAMFDGGTGPALDVVCLNAGAGLFVCGAVPGLAEGVAMARDAVTSGKARAALEGFVAFTVDAAS
jgi:anthranilate phosphoribosyltransferase